MAWYFRLTALVVIRSIAVQLTGIERNDLQYKG